MKVVANRQLDFSKNFVPIGNALDFPMKPADKEYWIVQISSSGSSTLSNLGRNFKALKITDPLYTMRNYATNVRDKARLKNLKNRRESTSNFS